MSRVGRDVVGPGLRFVVEAAGFEAAVEDADEAVAELTKGGVVADVSSSHRVVGGAGARRPAEGAEGPLVHGVCESVVVDVTGQYGRLGAGGSRDG